MNIVAYNQYHDPVFHITLWFSKPECIGYIGNWSEEWKEVFEMTQAWVAENILANDMGILSMQIIKLEPNTEWIFKVNITYWNHP